MNNELYIGLNKLDFNDEINVKSQVVDITDSSIGVISRSFTIKIPLTSKNKKYLKFINLINSVQQTYDQARLLTDGQLVIKGKLKITAIKETSVSAIIEGNSWIDDLSDTYIDEIWTGSDDHKLTFSVITSSFTAADNASIFRYPLINWGKLIDAFDAGSIYIGDTLRPEDFVPAWSLYKTIERLFSTIGLSVDTDSWLYETETKKINILFPWRKHRDEADIANTKLRVDVNSDTDNYYGETHTTLTTQTVTYSPIINIAFNNITTDEASGWKVVGDYYEVPKSGAYRFEMGVYILSYHDTLGSFSSIVRNAEIWIKSNAGGGTILALDYVSSHTLNPFDGDVEIMTLDTGYVYLEAGEQIYIEVDISTQAYNAGSSRTVRVGIGANSFFKSHTPDADEVYRLYCSVNETQNPADYLPHITGLELLKEIKKIFGLLFWYDSLNNKIYIEQFNNFTGSTIVDWTDKIDKVDDIERKLLSSGAKRKYLFKYKVPEGDWLYPDEVAKNGIPFSKLVEINNDNTENATEEIEASIFAPTLKWVYGPSTEANYFPPTIYIGDDKVATYAYQFPRLRPTSFTPRLLKYNWEAPDAGESISSLALKNRIGSTYNLVTTVPKAETIDFSDIYNSISKRYKLIEQGSKLTVRIRMTPGEFSKFTNVLNGSENEGFRAVYKLTVNGSENLFTVKSIVFNGKIARVEMLSAFINSNISYNFDSATKTFDSTLITFDRN
jgi:hypothetical protein